jgi:hypothetical protein
VISHGRKLHSLHGVRVWLQSRFGTSMAAPGSLANTINSFREESMTHRSIIALLAVFMVPLACHSGTTASTAAARPDPGQPPPEQVARLTADGQLTRPRGFETWVMVGASTGLSYNQPRKAPVAGDAPGMFHNIYMQPWAYRYTMEHGAFPEGTMFVMTFYEPSRKSNPARGGFYEGDQVPGLEVHLKKAGVDSTGWGFYGFGDSTTASPRLPSNAPCYSCHATEAAFNHAFVQFYPALRPRLLAKADSLLTGAQ